MSSERLNHTPRNARIFKPYTWKYEKPFERQKISIQVHWRRLASGSFRFSCAIPVPSPIPSVNRANRAHLRRPHLFHEAKIPEALAETADWIPHFSPCTAHAMRSFKLKTTFYVNASLKLYCLPIIFIGFAMHLWERFKNVKISFLNHAQSGNNQRKLPEIEIPLNFIAIGFSWSSLSRNKLSKFSQPRTQNRIFQRKCFSSEKHLNWNLLLKRRMGDVENLLSKAEIRKIFFKIIFFCPNFKFTSLKIV